MTPVEGCPTDVVGLGTMFEHVELPSHLTGQAPWQQLPNSLDRGGGADTELCDRISDSNDGVV